MAFLDVPLEVPEAPYTFDILALLVRDAVQLFALEEAGCPRIVALNLPLAGDSR